MHDEEAKIENRNGFRSTMPDPHPRLNVPLAWNELKYCNTVIL
jgi:hypothetical protein